MLPIYSQRLFQLRRSREMSQEMLGGLLGVKKGAVSKYEKGVNQIPTEILLKICRIFNVPLDFFFEEKPGKGVRIPIYSSIGIEEGVCAEKSITGYEEIPKQWLASGEDYLALRVHDGSMEPEYRPGDILIIAMKNTCRDGEDAAVQTGNAPASVRRLYFRNGALILRPLNPDYELQAFTAEECKRLPVRILGVVAELRRKKDFFPHRDSAR